MQKKILFAFFLGFLATFVCLMLTAWVFVSELKDKRYISTMPNKHQIQTIKPLPLTLALSLQPEKQNINKGESVTVTISADGQKEILVIDLYVSFDPQLLTLQSLNKGDYFQNQLVFSKKIDAEKGNLIYALGSLAPQKTTGSLVKLTFLAKQTGIAAIQLQSTSKASVKGALTPQINRTNTAEVVIK